MLDKEKIKQDIEIVVNRRLNLLNGDYFILNEETNGFTNEIMEIIGSLLEEPKCVYNRTFTERKKYCKFCSIACGVRIEEPVNEDLEEAAKKYVMKEYPWQHGYENWDLPIKDFKAGAEWQKEKDQQTIELAEDHALLAGMMKEREEMTKNSVDATVHKGLYSKYVKEQNSDMLNKALEKYNSGDKVKIIIIKDD